MFFAEVIVAAFAGDVAIRGAPVSAQLGLNLVDVRRDALLGFSHWQYIVAMVGPTNAATQVMVAVERCMMSGLMFGVMFEGM